MTTCEKQGNIERIKWIDAHTSHTCLSARLIPLLTGAQLGVALGSGAHRARRVRQDGRSHRDQRRVGQRIIHLRPRHHHQRLAAANGCSPGPGRGLAPRCSSSCRSVCSLRSLHGRSSCCGARTASHCSAASNRPFARAHCEMSVFFIYFSCIFELQCFLELALFPCETLDSQETKSQIRIFPLQRTRHRP